MDNETIGIQWLSDERLRTYNLKKKIYIYKTRLKYGYIILAVIKARKMFPRRSRESWSSINSVIIKKSLNKGSYRSYSLESGSLGNLNYLAFGSCYFDTSSRCEPKNFYNRALDIWHWERKYICYISAGYKEVVRYENMEYNAGKWDAKDSRYRVYSFTAFTSALSRDVLSRTMTR